MSWFPAGAAATRRRDPGARHARSRRTRRSRSPSTSRSPRRSAASRPPVSPTTPGTWHAKNSHTIVFEPQDYGYGLGAKVSVALPERRQARRRPADRNARAPAPGRSRRLDAAPPAAARAARLPAAVVQRTDTSPRPPQAQEAAAIKPPSGTFDWSYPNVPDALKSFWSPGTSGIDDQGRAHGVRERPRDHHGDGLAGPAVWKSLIDAAVQGTSARRSATRSSTSA